MPGAFCSGSPMSSLTVNRLRVGQLGALTLGSHGRSVMGLICELLVRCSLRYLQTAGERPP